MKQVLKVVAVITILWLASENANASEYKVNYLANRKVPQAKEIAKAVRLYCSDVNLALSIIKAESDFKLYAVNSKSKDFGLMQISVYHVKKKQLDIEALLTSADYNIRHGCEILEWFTETYGQYEGVSRYNCGTRKSCPEWKSVRNYKRRVFNYKRKLEMLDNKININK